MLRESLFDNSRTRIRLASLNSIRSDIVEKADMSTVGAKIAPIVIARNCKRARPLRQPLEKWTFPASAPAANLIQDGELRTERLSRPEQT